MWRRKRLPCSETGRKCEFNVARQMVHNGLDGRVFRVRRLVCRRCGERVTVAKREPSSVPSAWHQECAVEANF